MSELGLSVAHAVTLASRRWRTRLNERLKSLGQTESRIAALQELAAFPNGLPQRQLARRLGVEEPTVVRVIDALEHQGWVRRHAHKLDRRSKLVQLTAEAPEMLEKAGEVLADMSHDAFSNLDPQELATCLKVLNTLSERLGQVDGPAGRPR